MLVSHFWDLKGLSPPPKPFDCLLLAIWVSMRSARQQGWDSCLQASFSNRFRLFSRFRFFSRLFFCIEFPLIWKSPFLPLKSILGRQSCHVWSVRAGNFAARLTEQKKGATINSCLVHRPHYSARPMRLGPRGPAVRLRYVTEIDREGLRRRRTPTG